MSEQEKGAAPPRDGDRRWPFSPLEPEAKPEGEQEKRMPRPGAPEPAIPPNQTGAKP